MAIATIDEYSRNCDCLIFPGASQNVWLSLIQPKISMCRQAMMITINKPIPMAMRCMLRIHQMSRAHSGNGRTLGAKAKTASSSLRLCQYSATTTATNTNNVPSPGSRVKLKLNMFCADADGDPADHGPRERTHPCYNRGGERVGEGVRTQVFDTGRR